MGEVKIGVTAVNEAVPSLNDAEDVSGADKVLDDGKAPLGGSPLDAARYADVVARACDAVRHGTSKAAAARVIYDSLAGESREVVLRAFVEGATVTPKGAPTYFYNITRQLRRSEGRAVKSSAKTVGKAPASS